MAEKRDWSWMKEHMPNVVALLRRERAEGRGSLIDECWRRGVLGQEPSWFFAWQNGISIGVPSVAFLQDPNQAALAKMFPNRMVLMLNGQMADPCTAPVEQPRELNARERAARELIEGNESSVLEAARAKRASHGAD